ncbi:ImmA/IrrE family metallo-endopeptidase [Lichenifustis flavocetrariae]|uniref:ImmA/IrrE family metallo-endopeptidase n=1 Tax=Lichenifustis flavocetrariae TaxID=2949735 RepID=A0AA42CNY7_9HYPH|nr:ImmA/IrrE family metallo-endopeptidase [Lichenifustis flavocetrariae]MCW6509875.1 ImmA/IrrE family metallo-endopeptidase [Lichenifustis flavocetrariae]
MSLSRAEAILESLGIDRPEDIDLEMVAWSLGAKVKYRPLCSCEARICGHGNKAIITVDDRKSARRVRFSLAHELGHWTHHRERLLICRSVDIGKSSGSRRDATDPEKVADRFASELILPSYILHPMLKGYRTLNLKTMREVGSAFNASLTATAIRIMQSNTFHAMIVCHRPGKKPWFERADCVPDRWFPKATLDCESYAKEVLANKTEQVHPRKIGADAWFDRPEAERYEVSEQSFPLPNNEVLTLLTFSDPAMMEEQRERRQYGLSIDPAIRVR